MPMGIRQELGGLGMHTVAYMGSRRASMGADPYNCARPAEKTHPGGSKGGDPSDQGVDYVFCQKLRGVGMLGICLT